MVSSGDSRQDGGRQTRGFRLPGQRGGAGRGCAPGAAAADHGAARGAGQGTDVRPR